MIHSPEEWEAIERTATAWAAFGATLMLAALLYWSFLSVYSVSLYYGR